MTSPIWLTIIRLKFGLDAPVVLLSHPVFELLPELVLNVSVLRLSGEVMEFVGVRFQIVQLFRWTMLVDSGASRLLFAGGEPCVEQFVFLPLTPPLGDFVGE